MTPSGAIVAVDFHEQARRRGGRAAAQPVVSVTPTMHPAQTGSYTLGFVLMAVVAGLALGVLLAVGRTGPSGAPATPKPELAAN